MDTNKRELKKGMPDFPADWGNLPDLPLDSFFSPLTDQDLKGFNGISIEELEAELNRSEHSCPFVSIRG